MWGDDFHKKFQVLEKKIHFFSVYYCCSKNLKRQSEHSGLRPDTSSCLCLVFVLIYLCLMCCWSANFENKIGGPSTHSNFSNRKDAMYL